MRHGCRSNIWKAVTRAVRGEPVTWQREGRTADGRRRCTQPRPVLLQDADDLLFREPAALHVRLLRWRTD
jgi:hypothetical protein